MEGRGDRRSRLRGYLFPWLHLAVLWTFAVAQPLLSLLGDNPEFFVARGSTRADVVTFALALVLLPPTALVGVELALFRFERVRRAVHLCFVAGLTGLLALHVVKDVSAGDGSIALALLLGVAGAVLYATAAPVRSMLSVLSPAPLLFLVVFLFFASTQELVLGSSDGGELAPASTDVPVVMVLFDEFPVTSLLEAPGRIDAKRYPNFAKLARESTWFTNTWAAAENTTYAIPAILTGDRPTTDELPTAQDHPQSVFTLFGASHRLHVWESITSVCPSDLCERERDGFGARMRSLYKDVAIVSGHQLLPRNLKDRLPSVTTTWGGFGDEDAAQANQQLSRQAGRQQNRLVGIDRVLDGAERDGDRPTLDVIHVLLPHIPWQYLPSGRQYSSQDLVPGLSENEQWGNDRLQTEQAWERHLLQVGFVDRLLGQIVRRLKAMGLWDRAVTVVTADHGVSFRPGDNRRAISHANAGEIAPVPFFLHRPGERSGRVIDSDIQTIDILPTLVDAAGGRVPWRLDGRSALAGGFRRDRIEVQRNEGEPFVFQPTQLARLRDAVIRHKVELFGTGDDSEYVAGPDRDLLGRRPAEVGLAPKLDASASLDQDAVLRQVDVRSGFLPSFITGSIDGDLPGAGDLAVAVNGRVEATTRAFELAGERKFAALVPEASLRQGANAVTVYAVESVAGHTRLSPLSRTSGAQGSYTLAGNEIESSRGKRYTLKSGWVSGNIDRSEVVGNTARFQGWAASTKAGKPAEAILVFSAGRFAGAVRPTIARPDVAKQFSIPAIERSGWSALVPLDALGDDHDDVELYAVVGDGATKLPFDCTREPQDFGC